MRELGVAVLFSLMFALPSSAQVAPFDTKVKVLPPSFLGHNIMAIANALEHSPFLKAKSEFESTGAYEKRVSQFPDHVYMGKLAGDSHLAFVVKGQPYSNAYNADSGVMTFSVRDSEGEVLMTQRSQPLGSYIASNAFGAKARISRSIDHKYTLSVPRGGIPTVIMKLSPEEARVLKTDARVLLVCHLASPYIEVSTEYHEGTMTERWDSKETTHSLFVALDEVWIINIRTGKVVFRQSYERLNCSHVVMELGIDGKYTGSHSAPCNDEALETKSKTSP